MFEFFGTQCVHYKHLLQIAEKTTWDTGKNLIDVNAEHSQHDSAASLRADLYRRLEAKGFLTISEFMTELAYATFGDNVQWGDKTPDYGFYMGIIHELWPNCKFIHITRDGLDTGWSMSKHSGCKLMVSAGYDNWCSLSYDGLYKKYETHSLPLKDYVSSWRRRMNRIRDEAKRIPDNLYLECSYDQLLENPEAVLTQIANFSDLSVDNQWLSNAMNGIREPRRNSISAVEIALLGPQNVQAISREYGARHFLRVESASVAELRLRSLQNADTSIEEGIHAAISVFAFASAAGRDSLVAQAALSVAKLLEKASLPVEVESWSRFAYEISLEDGFRPL